MKIGRGAAIATREADVAGGLYRSLGQEATAVAPAYALEARIDEDQTWAEESPLPAPGSGLSDVTCR